jgi:hypothetical protein
MANRVKIEIRDQRYKKDIDKLLNLFKTSERKKILRIAARPLVKAMQKTTEFDDYTGEARKQIKSMTFARSESYFVGPKKGEFISKRKRNGEYKKYHPFYLYFIEYGFTNARTGKYHAPTNFIQKAVNSSKPEVLSKITELVENKLRPFTK